MAINDATGNIEHNTQDVFSEIAASNEAINNQVGGGGTLTTSYKTWNDGTFNPFKQGTVTEQLFENFAGFDSNNIEAFGMAMGTYIKNVQDILAKLNQKQEVVKGAFQGKVADSLNSFFNSMRELLMSYAAAMEIETKRVIEANNNWLNSAQSVSGNIDTDAGEVEGSKVTLN